MLYRLLADATVITHFLYVLFVVFALPVILIGAFTKWDWVRNFWFRFVHLSMMLLVVVESWLGITCPLTTLEKHFRTLAGEQTYQGDFIATFMHDALFMDLPTWGFTLMYSLFGLLLVMTFLLIPPRMPRKLSRPKAPTQTIAG